MRLILLLLFVLLSATAASAKDRFLTTTLGQNKLITSADNVEVMANSASAVAVKDAAELDVGDEDAEVLALGDPEAVAVAVGEPLAAPVHTRRPDWFVPTPRLPGCCPTHAAAKWRGAQRAKPGVEGATGMRAMDADNDEAHAEPASGCSAAWPRVDTLTNVAGGLVDPEGRDDTTNTPLPHAAGAARG